MAKKLFTLLLSASVLVFSCKNNGDAKDTDTSLQPAPTSAPAQQAPNPVLGAKQFSDKLAATADAQLVDVRTPGEFENGHLAGAKNIDFNSGNFDEESNALDKAKPVFVYCQRGGRSADAATVLRDKGFKEVYEMDGGLIAWNNAGLPLGDNKMPAAPVAGMSKAQFDNLLNTDKYVLVDFNATWCGPCKQLSPILDKIAQEQGSKLQLVKIDVDENADLAKAFNITSIPLIHVYKNKTLVWEQVGLASQAEIESHLK